MRRSNYSNVGPSEAFENINGTLRIVKLDKPRKLNGFQNDYKTTFPRLFEPTVTLATTEKPENYMINNIDGYMPTLPNHTIFDHLSFYPADWPDFHRITIGGSVGTKDGSDISQNPVTRTYDVKTTAMVNSDPANLTPESALERARLESEIRKKIERSEKPPPEFDTVKRWQIDDLSRAMKEKRQKTADVQTPRLATSSSASSSDQQPFVDNDLMNQLENNAAGTVTDKYSGLGKEYVDRLINMGYVKSKTNVFGNIDVKKILDEVWDPDELVLNTKKSFDTSEQFQNEIIKQAKTMVIDKHVQEMEMQVLANHPNIEINSDTVFLSAANELAKYLTQNNLEFIRFDDVKNLLISVRLLLDSL